MKANNSNICMVYYYDDSSSQQVSPKKKKKNTIAMHDTFFTISQEKGEKCPRREE